MKFKVGVDLLFRLRLLTLRHIQL